MSLKIFFQEIIYKFLQEDTVHFLHYIHSTKCKILHTEHIAIENEILYHNAKFVTGVFMICKLTHGNLMTYSNMTASFLKAHTVILCDWICALRYQEIKFRYSNSVLVYSGIKNDWHYLITLDEYLDIAAF